jgi:non-ribosomal peptide synthetase component F
LGFNFHNSASPHLVFAGLTADYEPLKNNSSKFDINVIVIPRAHRNTVREQTDHRLEILWEYNGALFRPESIERMLEQYVNLLESMLQQPDQKIAELAILGEQERHQLLQQWNQTDAPYCQDKTLCELFEQQVLRTPDEIALVYNRRSLSYHQLNQKANQLAHVIRAQYQQEFGKSLGPDTLIALYLDRSLDMVIAIMAVLKAGGAYVPMSPSSPKSRIQYMLDDTKAPLLLTQQHHLENLGKRPTTLVVDTEHQASSDNLKPVSGPDDLAYVIYTSGTTGQPKGVMISHCNVAHLCAAQMDGFALRDCQRSLLFAPYVFDASVFELFVSLLNGLQVTICTEQQRQDPHALGQLIANEKIEFATLPPAILSLITPIELDSLKTLVIAGESPALGMMESVSQHCQIYNAYGPTEITVCASANLYQPGNVATNIGGRDKPQ